MQSPGFLARNIRWLGAVIIVLVAIMLLGALASRQQPSLEKEPENHTPLVEVLTVSLKEQVLGVRSQGLVKPKYSTDLVAQVSGEVVSLSPAFVRGGFVESGELLAEIDPTNYEVALENAKAGLASAEAALEQELAQSEVARVEWEEINDRPAPDLGLRKPQLAQAQSRVTAAKADLKRAQKDLERSRIIAPYDALITERAVSLGTFLNSGTRLGHIMDVSTAEVRLPVAGSDMRFLPAGGLGAEVQLALDASANDGWQARIIRSEGVIDSDTRMQYLVAEVIDPYHLTNASSGAAILPFGSYVVATIAGTKLPSAVEIPRSLIRGGRVALYKDGKLEMRAVEVERHAGGYSVVSSGLTNGDQLITTAIEFPVEGMAVMLKDDAQNAAAEPENTEAVQGDV